MGIWSCTAVTMFDALEYVLTIDFSAVSDDCFGLDVLKLVSLT